LEQVAFLDTLTVSWELVPLSFILDWFATTRQTVQRLSDTLSSLFLDKTDSMEPWLSARSHIYVKGWVEPDDLIIRYEARLAPALISAKWFNVSTLNGWVFNSSIAQHNLYKDWLARYLPRPERSGEIETAVPQVSLVARIASQGADELQAKEALYSIGSQYVRYPLKDDSLEGWVSWIPRNQMQLSPGQLLTLCELVIGQL
jgi:hypothetical protein